MNNLNEFFNKKIFDFEQSFINYNYYLRFKKLKNKLNIKFPIS